jgi:starvation-inducible DNA-binding protein
MSMKSSAKSPSKTIVRAVEAQPHLDLERGQETQPWGTLTDLPIALSEQTRLQSIEALNQLLADTMSLRDMYKKHHWQVSGPTFYQLHLLFDAHFKAQSELVDTIAERIMSLGGVSVAMAHDVAEMTMIRRPPKGRENPAMQLTRLVEAHRHILASSRRAAKAAAEAGDDGTNDLFVSDVIRQNELQTWFLAEHLVSARLE